MNENVFETDLVSWTGHCLDSFYPESKGRGTIHEIKGNVGYNGHACLRL